MGQDDPGTPAPLVSGSLDLRLVSRYVWRGYDLSAGRAALQTYGTLGLGEAVELSAFTSSAPRTAARIDDIQLGVAYSRSIGGPWEASLGYLAYVTPGRDGEPTETSGEATAALTVGWDAGSVTVTYARGHGLAAGNSVNLWLEHEVPLRGPLTAVPYAQFDYLDQYGAPRVLRDRLAGIEAGLPLKLQLGSWRVEAAVTATYVPSRYVRAANEAAGGTARRWLPWGALAVTYAPE
jgi:hypothetical protein